MSGGKENHVRVAIIGGGLVGAVNACFFAKRGFHVDLYEARKDIREEAVVQGKSINLALSCRGRAALHAVGLEKTVVENGIPMNARMIHGVDGNRKPIPYGKKDQYIMSISRRLLNEELLSAADKYSNVTLHFEHKLQSCDFNIGQVVLQRPDGTTVSKQVDLIVGNDGAFSMVRRQMMKTVRFDYQQEYIPHGYMELCIEPTKDNQYAMETNFLHIWPRNEFMMIALPNLDKTFTTTLFMPFEMFDKIQTEEQLLQFFRETFPDSLPLLGEEALIKTYMNSKGLPMISIKCSPYHVGTKAVIMGDAAHAMVPFYGQGMNAGFEDCLVLNELMDKYNNDLSKVLPEYTRIRSVDAKAICDLAMYNYIEMRASVNSKLFLLRKYLDNFLHWLFPKHWVPLYTMVSFTRTRYHEAINKRKWQDKVLTNCNRLLGVATLVGAVFLLRRLAGNTDFSQSAISRLSVLQETVLDHFPKWS